MSPINTAHPQRHLATGECRSGFAKTTRRALFTLSAILFPNLAIAQPDVSIIYESEFGTLGREPGQFSAIRGITVGKSGEIILADAGNERIQVCDPTGQCFVFGRRGSAPGEFDNVHGVAVDSANRILTVETGTARVQIFSPDSEPLQMFGRSGVALGQFRVPAGVWVDSLDRILIADEANDRIQICSDTGVCEAFGTEGVEPGQFSFPRAVAVDGAGRILVSELFNHRVSICEEHGPCTFFGGPQPGDAVGMFEQPRELIPDGSGHIIIADGGNHRLQVCDYDGHCVAFGEFGSGPGQFSSPVGVAMDTEGRLYVGDQGNRRVQVFRYSAGFRINQGLNDAWFNPDTSGQGFFIVVFADRRQMFLSWFTFDTERPAAGVSANLGAPGQRWLTAFGPYEGNTAELEVQITEGGLFDAPTPRPATRTDGSMIVEMTDCEHGIIRYEIASIGRQGEIPIQRLAPDNVATCDALAE